MSPKLSIVILNWNSKRDLESCLSSIYKNTSLKGREIIIVDNGSTDRSTDYIEEEYPEIILIKNTENKGVGPARNQGLRIAKGEYILVLDVDTEVRPRAIDILVEEMDKHSEVGLSGAQLVYPDGSLQYSCREFPTVLGKFIFRRLPEKLARRFLSKEEYRNWDHQSPAYVGYVIGACQLIRKVCLDRVGFYDDRIFYGPEDMDYCLRLWKAGWRVLYNPRAEIIHKEARITKSGVLIQMKNPVFWRHLEGLAVYFLKHRYLLRRPGPFFALVGDDTKLSGEIKR
ncbi:MAG: hypothetical protein BMS9Abin34_391 [Patescibacteria group bacterium]|nr:MAG: hypothetical protein BMS9Abin34_391 [Patescibacteria group bacterium]